MKTRTTPPPANPHKGSHGSLTIAHTADTDDAFYYAALKSGAVRLADCKLHFFEGHIHALNQDALQGRFDVVATSSAMYPLLAPSYRILCAGTSVGRGYGPLLASARPLDRRDLSGCRVGIAGPRTTGAFLLRFFHPGAIPVSCDYRAMASRVLAGELDAAVLIHEELLLSKERGLKPVECLGKRWCQSFGGPLPVGLNLIHRRIPLEAARRICAAIRGSLAHGLEHRAATLEQISGLDRGAMDDFVARFANEDSLALSPDVRRSLVVLMNQVCTLYDDASRPPLDVVEAARVQGQAEETLARAARGPA